LIRGRPIFFNTTRRNYDWKQTTLYKSVVVPDGLMLAAMRENAAANGSRLVVSPDGNWVSIVGGGGWRSRSPKGHNNYGMAVINALDLRQVQGFYPSDAYPIGISFNPFTGQLVTINNTHGKDSAARIFHMTDTKKYSSLKGSFNGVATWTGDGKYVLLANKKTGLSVYRNQLTSEEEKIAQNWWKDKEDVKKLSTTRVQAALKPMLIFSDFTIKSDRITIQKALVKAFKEGHTRQPLSWKNYQVYIEDQEVYNAISESEETLKPGENAGVVIYQLKKLIQKHPESAPLVFHIATALKYSGQHQAARKYFQEAIKLDQGRTEITADALNECALILIKQDDEMKAIYCLANSLFLDKDNPQTLGTLSNLLENNKFQQESKQLALLIVEVPVTSGGLPKLEKRSTASKRFSVSEIYEETVEAVVYIQAGETTGSGFCIGQPDIIVTNYHIVENAQVINVYPFIYKNGKTVKMKKMRASVIFRSQADDFAVLKFSLSMTNLFSHMKITLGHFFPILMTF